MLYLAGELLFKQLLMGLGEWASEGRLLYSDGAACCVVVCGRAGV